MKRCIRCILPETKPNIWFNEDGLCSACINYDERQKIDWPAREQELISLLGKYKNKTNWDCIIPVSGGKDSTYQTIKMLEYGMNPLCVTATTCDLSELGRKNIENLKWLGVDYIELSPNKKVRAKLNRIGLEEVGDISWPEHVSIFTIPIRVAVAYNVPLIIWGENPQNEYGGPAAASQDRGLTRRWLEEFGGLLGLRVSDLEAFGLLERDLIPYTYPTDDELKRVGVTGLFLGYFLPWNGFDNAKLARKHGFKFYSGGVEASGFRYENLDNHQTGIHDYMKWLKYGFGRASDIASMHVRRGLMTRDEAFIHAAQWETQYPSSYLGKPLAEILKPLGLTVSEFDKICDKFTNRKIHVEEKNYPDNLV